ncbi:MAG: hypothetical protein NVSMB62_01730 [Acidobacteriaceae bacterium]
MPSLAQLQENRLKRWHQTGEALLTLENLRSWLNASGLVLFAPRPQIASPAPTLVEAVLGAPNANPTLEQTAEARSLLGRLIAEGIAVPLNLLGTPSGAVGEAPDFVASAAVFSYIFTLRGDKGWKQPPTVSGPVKVSQLAANTHEILVRLGAKSAYDLARELGNEVTEAAVLRALGELWTHLRVLPQPQPDDRPTLWELTGTRFIKQIKAGANAGQPSALSALISLYLGQVAVATEEEIEVFLSPLAARSRVRDVLHALTAARQLDTLAIEGRTMLRLTGETADFLPPPVKTEPEAETAEKSTEGSATPADEAVEGDSTERIKKFVPKPRKIGTGYLSKGSPAKGAGRSAGSSFAARRASGAGPEGERERRPFQERADGEARPFVKKRTDGEERPFARKSPAGDRPRFDRPWQEGKPRPSADGASERPSRPRTEFADRRPARGEAGAPERRAPRRDGGKEGGWKPAARSGPGRETSGSRDFKPRRESSTGGAPRERSSFADRGSRPSSFGDRGARPGGFTKRPAGPGRAGSAGNTNRPFRSRTEAGPGAERPERPTYRKFDAPRGPAKRPYVRKGAEGDRPDRSRDDKPRREFRPREGAAGGARPDRASAGFAGKPRFAGKPGTGFDKKRTGFTDKPRTGFDDKPRTGFAGKPKTGFAGKPRTGFAGKPREGFAAKRTSPRPATGAPPREGGFAARPAARGGFTRKPTFGDRPQRPSGGASFAKKAISGERPLRRKFRPKGDETA